MSFPGNKMKALTFSYDDGVEQDRRLVELLNRYHLKCTFNLNSGIQSGSSLWENNGVVIRRMNVPGLLELYKGHEIAVHTLTHTWLPQQDDESIRNEIVQDKRNLQSLFGCEIKGMAYPYGTYDDRVLSVLKDNDFQYARTTVCTENFDLQDNLLEFKPTCHHASEKLMALAEEFINLHTSEPKIFYVWGHSYEFDVNRNWDTIERF
jgi:peptidoglycan/xylan/chitin deacetylase (PgdA/CDA1 family)